MNGTVTRCCRCDPPHRPWNPESIHAEGELLASLGYENVVMWCEVCRSHTSRWRKPAMPDFAAMSAAMMPQVPPPAEWWRDVCSLDGVAHLGYEWRRGQAA